MSTRSNTRIIKKNGEIVRYYKHHDGYREGVGQMLIDWLKEDGFENIQDNMEIHRFELRDYYNDDAEYIYTIDMRDKVLYYTKNKLFMHGPDDDSQIEDMNHIILYYEEI